MKKNMYLAICVAISLTVLPLCMYNSSADVKDKTVISQMSSTQTTTQPESESESNIPETTEKDSTQAEQEMICIYLSDKKEALTLPLHDYIIGVVAAEMPAAYEKEALKAQAAASITLARRKMQTAGDTDELDGAVITTNSKKDQGYMSVDKMRERWGEEFDTYYEKIAAAVDEVYSYQIEYEGEPIVAAFHAISTGLTECAENVWEEKKDYLVSVESEGDKLSSTYESTLSLSGEKLEEYLNDATGFKSRGKESEWIGECEYTEAGTLVSVEICDEVFTGAALREILSLRSAAMEIDFADGEFVFTVKGYGHGVGLSQYGADYYARQGYTWQEIIAHYYPGTQLEQI
ncbi:MAG: stage II sporulation protein D [Clostridia bacterium]|nr:stage II sporulation protein D [Clostridia bacterium]